MQVVPDVLAVDLDSRPEANGTFPRVRHADPIDSVIRHLLQPVSVETNSHAFPRLIRSGVVDVDRLSSLRVLNAEPYEGIVVPRIPEIMESGKLSLRFV